MHAGLCLIEVNWFFSLTLYSFYLFYFFCKYKFIRQYLEFCVDFDSRSTFKWRINTKRPKRKHTHPTPYRCFVFYNLLQMYYIKLSPGLYWGLKVLEADAGCWFHIELLVLKDGIWDMEGISRGSKKKIRTPPPCRPKYINFLNENTLTYSFHKELWNTF